jgi:hypothetical protein
MKNTALQIAAAAALLLAPIVSFADDNQSFSDVANISFITDRVGTMSFDLSWTDLVASYSIGRNRQSPLETFSADSLRWDLFDSRNKSVLHGSFNDASNALNQAQVVIDETGLRGTNYTLVFKGKWEPEDHKWKVSTPVDVSIAATPISPVPEPETYAMFLAGLGLMGTIALRRKSS